MGKDEKRDARKIFAAVAMHAAISGRRGIDGETEVSIERMAQAAVAQADALIAELEKPDAPPPA